MTRKCEEVQCFKPNDGNLCFEVRTGSGTLAIRNRFTSETICWVDSHAVPDFLATVQAACAAAAEERRWEDETRLKAEFAEAAKAK